MECVPCEGCCCADGNAVLLQLQVGSRLKRINSTAVGCDGVLGRYCVDGSAVLLITSRVQTKKDLAQLGAGMQCVPRRERVQA
eukprot:scaffold176178_cov16-Tisochrysis_lutea.AAC.2